MMVGKAWLFLGAIIPCQLEQAFVCGYGRDIFWRDIFGFGRIPEKIEVEAIGGIFDGVKETHACRSITNFA